MARKKAVNTTKLAIVQVSTRMFLKRGFSNTSVKAIANELGISTGNLTFHFPTKEHLLSVLAEMLCDFQWRMIEQNVDEGRSSIMAVCLELVAMAAICEENEVAKDLYLSAYTNPMSLEVIRRNDARRAKEVFGEYCTDWTDEHFAAAETLVSGIEYATLMTTPDSAPLPIRIAGGLNQILALYQVPPETRAAKINKVLTMDYAGIGRQIFSAFIRYIDEITEQIFDELT